ncbi:MAG: hypothetical protein KDK70_33830 [Myxococcales bacterium]|nr:hypothetical protein [Myxococcales bacterium]
MTRRLALALLLLAAACREGYDNNDAELAVRQRAKEMCSCLFVQQRDEAYCRAFTRVTPDVAKPDVDYARKRVTATALGFYRSAASFREGLGCALEQ